MSIEQGTGSIFESGCEAIVIPVNCVATAGKGLALAMKRRCPPWFTDYKAQCAAGRVVVGHVRSAVRPIVPIVFNFPTKDHWRDPSEIVWIRDGLADLAQRLKQSGRSADSTIESIAIPALGCGEGGLAWDEVRPLIEATFRDSPVRVVVYGPQGGEKR